ncbi:hypothetical protein Zmor_006436 [Zophobas morio]|uniref:Uncharacterized protein n=1 Tax=Zophobas morio TaxID=2755281 RepID=A0AA38ISB6_9CUCU|nr:hypothetical protein Zmor_006436 [Zophobas morio]
MESEEESENIDIEEFYRISMQLQRNPNQGSLWAEYSMIRFMTNHNDGTDISKYSKLLAFLETETPDKDFLVMKVVMIMGIARACRKHELCALTVEDIEDKGTSIVVKIPNTKTRIPRTFTTIDHEKYGISFLEVCRKMLICDLPMRNPIIVF